MNVNENVLGKTVSKGWIHTIGVNPWGWGSRPPRFWDVGSSWNVIVSYDVQDYEMRTLSKVVTSQKLNDLYMSARGMVSHMWTKSDRGRRSKKQVLFWPQPLMHKGPSIKDDVLQLGKGFKKVWQRRGVEIMCYVTHIFFHWTYKSWSFTFCCYF